LQLIRTLASWRPNLPAYRDFESTIASASNPSPVDLELHDEIANLDAMIGAIVDELAPRVGHLVAAEASPARPVVDRSLRRRTMVLGSCAVAEPTRRQSAEG
jgi:hypothetical protein